MDLGQLLAKVIKERGISIRQAARDAGVTHTTLNRILNGAVVDITTLEKLAVFLDVSLSSLINLVAPAVSGRPDLPARIAVLTERKPELAEVFDKIASAIEAGEMDDSDLDEVIRYAEYRLDNMLHRRSHETQDIANAEGGR
jgi:transcriptional regulator with XRE-family HTH domain